MKENAFHLLDSLPRVLSNYNFSWQCNLHIIWLLTALDWTVMPILMKYRKLKRKYFTICYFLLLSTQSKPNKPSISFKHFIFLIWTIFHYFEVFFVLSPVFLCCTAFFHFIELLVIYLLPFCVLKAKRSSRNLL